MDKVLINISLPNIFFRLLLLGRYCQISQAVMAPAGMNALLRLDKSHTVQGRVLARIWKLGNQSYQL